MLFFSSSKCFASVLVLLAAAPAAVSGTFQAEAEGTSNPVVQSRLTVFQDFKAVLMYFSEAFLKGAKFGDQQLEGEQTLVMPAKLLHLLAQFEIRTRYQERLKALGIFKRHLHAGLVIARRIESLSSKINVPRVKTTDMIVSAKLIQDLALQSIVANDGIIIPTGWVGHATTMVIKPGSKAGFYNLAYINSGIGLQHHYVKSDPDNVYPHLSKLWIEFKDIPHEEIFNSDTAWFIYALALVKNSDFAGTIQIHLDDGIESLPNYFYGSLLANFKGYLAVPQGDEIHDRLVPEQQSGSCAMSSLMGALLYYSDSLKTFHWYRLKIGHVFLEMFLKRLGPIIEQSSLAEDDLKFLSILKDGFFSGGSKHFYGLIRALANHHLQYLEHEFPEEFKHAGLIGSGRSDWIREKKAVAIEKISTNEAAKKDLQTTITLAQSVHRMALKFQFRPETTHISDLRGGEIYLDQREEGLDPEIAEGLQITVTDGGDILKNFVSGNPDLLEIELIPIATFEDFHWKFAELFKYQDSHKEVYFMRFLDIFKGLRAGGGWELVHNHREKDQLLHLQRLCLHVAFRFAELSNSYENVDLRKSTMDEITLLGHLQLLAWNLFKALHKLDFPNPQINWERLAPPQTIQSVLFDYGGNRNAGNLISGFMKALPIKSFNSIENYKLYQLFLEDSRTESIDISQNSGILSAFPGPESFQSHSGRPTVALNVSMFQKCKENSIYQEILNSFTNSPQVKAIFNELRRNNASWAKYSIDHAKFLIVMYKGQKRLSPQLQHFYNLMSTLQCLGLGVRNEGIEFNNDGNDFFWIDLDSKDTENPDLSLKGSLSRSYLAGDRVFENYTLSQIRNSGSASDLFYHFRHSYAHPEEIGFTDVDTWFNYIKNANSSKIFDSSYFQYITDHLLNIPKYIKNRSVLLFSAEKPRNIVLELIKLIRNTLNELNVETKIMTTSRREIIVRRAVNISVITTRFISRMDNEFKDNSRDPVDWASLLAGLYKTLEPYSYLNSPILKLSATDVSMLNFALSHVCYTHLQVPENFTKSVSLGFDHQMNRKTLARFHWFVAKMNYRLSADDMIADDQFKYGGFLGSPLERSEFGFLQSLLKEKFLPHYLQIKSDSEYVFQHERKGYIVEISLDSPQTRLLINLATGAIIENSLMSANKSPFINSFEFQKYFPPQSHDFLSLKGRAFMFSGVPVFSLPTFKGANYVMIQNVDKFWLLRKWGSDWYIWMPKDKLGCFLEALNCKYLGKPVTTFKRHKRDIHGAEMIIFDEGAKDPIVKITKNRRDNLVSYQLSIPGLTDGFSGEIINHGNRLEPHLDAFAEEGITVARQESDGTLIVVYNSYRIPDDPTRPFVLTSSPSDKVIRVRNIQGMEICQDQRIGKDGSGLPGSLVATIDGKKFLLLPFTEVMERSKTPIPQRSYVSIEKITVVDDPDGNYFAVPAPQSRMHRLLLAYYLILAQSYDSARKLLHPATSFHHNEAFSKEELEIILWTLRIDMKAPEFNALIIVVYSHFLINEAKFTFENKQNLSDLVQKVKDNDPAEIFTRYMMAIRELPEKYYIFKIFPEILVEASTLSRAFLEFGRIRASRMPKKPSEEIEFPENVSYKSSTDILQHEFGTRQSLEYMMHLMIKSDSSLNPAEKNLIKYLLVRNNSRRKFDKSYEMAIYCYISQPKLWAGFKGALVRISLRGNGLSDMESLSSMFNSAISQCQDQYRSQFEGISLAHLSESTDSQMIRKTMKNELGIIQDYEAEIMDHVIEIDTKIEREVILRFRDYLKAQIKPSSSDNADEDRFDHKLIGARPVLTGLSNSMASFISEKAVLNIVDAEKLSAGLRSLHETLSKRIAAIKADQEAYAECLAFMASVPHDSQSIFAHSLEKLFSFMHHRKEKTFSDLYACFLRNPSSSCIQKKFPQLDSEQCKNLNDNSIIYFSQQILLDYLKMIQESAQPFMASASIPIEDLLIFCDELEKISDFNTRIKNPVIMNFEFRSKKYRLKSEQVADIALLTAKEEEPDGNFKSVVIQRMMAAGKTLVLGTISVVRKALEGRGKLSILVPPSSLYQSNTSAMQNRTYQYFKKKGNNFSFPRLPLATDEKIGQRVSVYLANVIQIINQTIESRNYLILSPDHLQSFMNSYIEAIENAKVLCTGDNYDRYSTILKQFATIYQIFKEQSSIILDEIDMTMDPKKELNFPTNNTETYNMTAVAMLADIIEFMLYDQDIKEAGLNIHSNNQAALTPENYIKCRVIVLNHIENQLKDETSIWRKFVHENDTDDVMIFLWAENISFGKDWMDHLFEHKKSGFANALIIVKTQLYLHLQEFFGGTVNQNYGSAGPLRPQIKYAVPYVAANTPSAGSVFADRWETLTKTMLMISASPCSIETAKDLIKYVRQTILAESAGKAESEVTILPTFQNIKMILPAGFDVMELNENEPIHVANVHRGLINRSPAAIRIIYGYFVNEVLSKMEFPVDQITSNALNMTSMFASVQGYSGTIDNVNILPRRVVCAAAIDHEDNEKNNGGIALKLIKDSGDAIIPELGDDSLALPADEMMSRFLDIFKLLPIDKAVPMNQVSAIIDAGAFFKNFKNRQVAGAILRYFEGRIETVLYYDETSNQLEFIRGTINSGGISFTVGFLDTTDPDDISRATQTRIEERFTFYDQRHITGSDILQPKGAHAIMSAGPRVLLRDILQGTLRMRQFMTSQKVHLVITESVRKFYSSKIGDEKEILSVSDVLTLGALNEDEKQKLENEKLAFGKIDAEIRAFVLDEISKKLTDDPTDIDIGKIISLYTANRELFVRSIRETPVLWLVDRESQNAANILEEHVRFRLSNLSPLLTLSDELSRYHIFTSNLEFMYRIEHKSRCDSLLTYLGEEILARVANSIGSEVLMQNQIQTLTLMDLDLDLKLDELRGGRFLLKQFTFDLLKEQDKSVVFGVDDFVSLKTVYDGQPDSRKDLVRSILLTDGNDIGATRDLMQYFEIPDGNRNSYPIFSKYNMEGSHFLVYAHPDNLEHPKVILLSPRHASKVFMSLHRHKFDNYIFWLCDLSGDVIFAKNYSASPAENIFSMKELNPKIGPLIFDILIFNGSFPQILANPELREIYENYWMSITDFQSRATFLRLRMRALAEKDSQIFEDDDSDYVKLKRYSTGDFVTEKAVSRTDWYSKSAINSEIQAEFVQEHHPTVADETVLSVKESKSTFGAMEQYLQDIFREINYVNVN